MDNYPTYNGQTSIPKERVRCFARWEWLPQTKDSRSIHNTTTSYSKLSFRVPLAVAGTAYTCTRQASTPSKATDTVYRLVYGWRGPSGHQHPTPINWNTRNPATWVFILLILRQPQDWGWWGLIWLSGLATQCHNTYSVFRWQPHGGDHISSWPSTTSQEGTILVSSHSKLHTYTSWC